MDEQAISIVRDYIEECLPEPTLKMSKHQFLWASYSRWSANELLGRMIDEYCKPPEYITGVPSESPIGVINEFVHEMEYYYDESDGKESQLMFFIAKEEGRNILELFTKGDADEQTQSYCWN